MESKEQLHRAATDAERAHEQASQIEAKHSADATTVKGKIADLETRYETACLHTAQGNAKAEDPGTLLAERDRHSHRLRGIEQMHRAAISDSQQTAQALVKATSALQAHEDEEELRRLEQVVADADVRIGTARLAIIVAEKERHNAVWRKEQHTNHMKAKAKAIA